MFNITQIISKFIKNSSQRELDRLTPLIKKINELRKQEEIALWKSKIIKAFSDYSPYILQYISIFITILNTYLEGNMIKFEALMQLILWSHSVKFEICIIPSYFIEVLSEVSVSFARIQEFLLTKHNNG